MPRLRAHLTQGAVARAIVHQAVAGLPVLLRYPDGSVVGGGGADAPILEVVRPRALFRRLESHPKIGLGEGYMAGDWRAAPGTDLAELLAPFAARVSRLVPKPLQTMRAFVDQRLPLSSATPSPARGPTSRRTTTSATISSPASSTRR